MWFLTHLSFFSDWSSQELSHFHLTNNVNYISHQVIFAIFARKIAVQFEFLVWTILL